MKMLVSDDLDGATDTYELEYAFTAPNNEAYVVTDFKYATGTTELAKTDAVNMEMAFQYV
jgi:hypothetical protein